MATWEVIHGDCLEVLRGMPANSIDAVVTDPPYFRVKGEAWDRQWDTPSAFLAWLGTIADEWARVLKPNGSLYCFASPRMAARVEVMIGERFNVVNSIVWNKGELPTGGRHKAANKESLRGYFPATERIIFAEHFGADNIAKGEAGYKAKCDELRGFVFEPLRAYLDGERLRAGFDRAACDAACWNQMSGHYFSRVQWTLPTRANYEKLRAAFNANGGDHLRREYEDLRREYEDLRRPFAVTADVPYTDVWNFPTVPFYPGKHPCEKPQDLLRHIITASTRPGAIVLDTFAGTGSCGVACDALGRNFIGIELDAGYCEIARRRIAHAAETLYTEAQRT